MPWVSNGYSVLTHEAIIDVCWDSSIRPALLMRYPQSTDAQLKEARAYAYGGSVAGDIGYYPYGAKLFTDLVHYVRSGDFVAALIDEAQNVNEYAFALGVLCHYYADVCGHPLGTNRCVPIVYPKVRRRFGPVVTYAQHPLSHIRMEFGFDVLQTARGNYASEQYHDFIGFQIARPVLERAFLKTYGLNINDVFKDLGKAIGTYRWIIVHVFPTITRMAWAGKKKEIQSAHPAVTRRKFQYHMRRAKYYQEFGRKRHKPGFSASFAATVMRIIPKVGPLRKYKIRIPDAEAEKLFIHSFDTTVMQYTAAVKRASRGGVNLQNVDYDTGVKTCPGEYVLVDKNYGVLLLELKKNNFAAVNAPLRQNILSFYGNADEEVFAQASPADYLMLKQALDELQALPLGMR
jgi:hypothetical protein